MKKAFSLMELSIVILIIGIIIAGATASSNLIYEYRVETARNLTETSNVHSISGLALWFDALNHENITSVEKGLGYAEEGDTISAWKSRNDQDTKLSATQSNEDERPTYIEEGINNIPTISFDGSDDALEIANHPLIAPINDFTIFLVFRAFDKGDGSIGGLLSRDATSELNNPTYEIDYNYGRNRIDIAINDNDDNRSTMLSPNDGMNLEQDYIIVITNEMDEGSSGFTMYIDGSLISSTDARTPSIYGSDLIIGRQKSSSGRHFQGYISEFIMYHNALESDERQDIEKYLSQKYNIDLS